MENNETQNSPLIQKLFQAWWWIPGLMIFVFGLYGLVFNIPVVDTLWYIFGWYGYLLVLDVVIYCIQDHSFISDRKIELLEMLLWSVSFWYIYEAYNLILKNWYYIFGFKSPVVQFIYGLLAFATVFPASFFHYELLKALGLFEDSTPSPRAFKILRPFSKYFGALCIILPLIIPKYTFWMVWGATLGIPAVINYNIGAESLLRDLKQGTATRVYRLLVGGLMAGVVWEGLNYWARCKWIYTVPGLEELKLFEIPVLGLLGFPILAVSSFSYYSLLNHFLRGGRHWEIKDGEQQNKSRSSGYIPAVIISVIFSIVVFIGLFNINYKSTRPLLREIPALNSTRVKKLKKTGIHSPEQLYSHAQRQGVNVVAKNANLKTDIVKKSFEFCSLMLHKGMGYKNAVLLNRIGIYTVDQLEDRSPSKIYQNIRNVEKSNSYPRMKEIQVWIRAAELFGRTKR